MKRRTFLALGLAAALSIPFATTAFAAETQYKKGSYIEFSGIPDFNYYYTYLDTYKGNKWDFKCFSVVSDDGQRWYAAVRNGVYEYCREIFENQAITLKGEVQIPADDGTPIIWITERVAEKSDGEKEYTSIQDCLWEVIYSHNVEPNFKLFSDLYTNTTVTLADDESYLMIDTNPSNISGGSLSQDSALNEIQKFNKFFGLPDWIYQEMLKTRAIDGRQLEEFDKVTVSWSYHPDYGLEVIYRKKQ